jgi:hypothetical protein
MRTIAAALLAVLMPLAAAANETAPVYTYTWVPPESVGSPRILKVELNSDRLRAGGPIAIRVTTSRNVVQVVTGKGDRQGSLTKEQPGVFESISTLPHLGGLLTVRIAIHVTATTAAGKSASVDVPVLYR